MKLRYKALISIVYIGLFLGLFFKVLPDIDEGYKAIDNISKTKENTTKENITFGHIFNMTYNDTYKNFCWGRWCESKPIQCEIEQKVRGDENWGYSICTRCKDINKSIWIGKIPAGGWIC